MNVSNQNARFAWSNTKSTSINANEVLFVIQATVVSDVDKSKFTVNNGSEFSDASGIVISDVKLQYPGLDFSVEIENLNKENIAVYPNPVTSHTAVQFPESFSGNLTLTDISGRKIFSNSVENVETFHVNMEKLNSGTYFLEVSNSELKKVIKLIKE